MEEHGVCHIPVPVILHVHIPTQKHHRNLLPTLFIVLKMWWIKMLIFGINFQEFFCPFVSELATPLQDTSI